MCGREPEPATALACRGVQGRPPGQRPRIGQRRPQLAGVQVARVQRRRDREQHAAQSPGLPEQLVVGGGLVHGERRRLQNHGDGGAGEPGDQAVRRHAERQLRTRTD
jgi:hypothetical protein